MKTKGKITNKFPFLFMLILISMSSKMYAQKMQDSIDIPSYLHSAADLQDLYKKGNYTDECLFSSSEILYQAILSSDPESIKGNYGLGALYYNRAVRLNKYMQDNEKKLSDVELEKQMTEFNSWMEKSKPYLEHYNQLIKK